MSTWQPGEKNQVINLQVGFGISTSAVTTEGSHKLWLLRSTDYSSHKTNSQEDFKGNIILQKSACTKLPHDNLGNQ